MEGLIYDDLPNGLVQFILLTVLLGGAGALVSGRAVASGWKSYMIVPVYMLLMAAFIRFLHYALFGGELLSLPLYLVALIILLASSAYGYRAKRSRQMATQYSWLFARSGSLGWRTK